MPSRRYDAPSRKFGRKFVKTLGGELHGVRNRQWNLERFIVFHTVILQLNQHVTAPNTIQRWIGEQLDDCEDGKYGMLVEDTLRICAQYLTVA